MEAQIYGSSQEGDALQGKTQGVHESAAFILIIRGGVKATAAWKGQHRGMMGDMFEDM